MKLLTLSLKNFRNYKEAEISFDPGLNLIIGDNAQGKSNLLEAIYLVMTGRSYRTSRLKELIRWGADTFTVKATFVKHDIEQSILVGYNGQDRRILHNDTQLPSFASLLGILQGEMLCPEDRDLISGPPALRRRFLDLHISQIDPTYLTSLGRYHRALKQRNQLLRSGQTDTLAIWEEQMAPCAIYIKHARQEAIDKLKPTSQDPLMITYRPSIPAWEENRTQEAILGHTLTGPHRDDISITLDRHQMRSFGSEGQKMSTAIALRFSQYDLLNTSIDETPLMLIDDVSGNLDLGRQKKIKDHLGSMGQVFFTSPLDHAGKCFYVTNGMIAERESRSTSNLV